MFLGSVELIWLFTKCLIATSGLLKAGFTSWHRPFCAISEDPGLMAREVDFHFQILPIEGLSYLEVKKLGLSPFEQRMDSS